MAKGFYSSNTRAVVVQHGVQALPAAYSVDGGTVFKPFSRMIVNAAVWYIGLGLDFVYGGDGGSVAFNGKTRRKGFDLSVRYEPLKSLYADGDLNYAHGGRLAQPKAKITFRWRLCGRAVQASPAPATKASTAACVTAMLATVRPMKITV